MKLYINVKQTGTRKNFINREEILFSTAPSTLREMISAIVTEKVKSFNDKVNGRVLLRFLTNSEINAKASIGKVAFGEIYNQTEADLGKALKGAFLAYEDGLYRVLVNDKEAKGLDDKLELRECDVLTFIKLTMLAGRMW